MRLRLASAAVAVFCFFVSLLTLLKEVLYIRQEQSQKFCSKAGVGGLRLHPSSPMIFQGIKNMYNKDITVTDNMHNYYWKHVTTNCQEQARKCFITTYSHLPTIVAEVLAASLQFSILST